MLYTVKDNSSGRCFQTESLFEIDLDVVWLSVKSWFISGNTITITDENGKSKTFSK